jgi:hypothetical protein
MNNDGISRSSVVTGISNPLKPKKWVYDGSSGGWLESFKQQEEITINDNFLLWIEHNYIKFPVFVGYFEKDSWKTL